jgi:hypothetical protein
VPAEEPTINSFPLFVINPDKMSNNEKKSILIYIPLRIEADVWRNAMGSENVMLSFSYTYLLFFIEISLPFKFSYSHCQTFPTDNGFDI